MTPVSETYRTEWETWRAGWEQWLTQPHGRLSAVAVNWLDDTPARFADTPGLWWQDGENRAVNLPCAFGDYFPICPTPPDGNRYPFRIEAGEKTPAK